MEHNDEVHSWISVDYIKCTTLNNFKSRINNGQTKKRPEASGSVKSCPDSGSAHLQVPQHPRHACYTSAGMLTLSCNYFRTFS